ncbi:MAG: YciC family protein [Candidatus Saccharimonadales bacterium]|nr:YciC family protein [Candidatus Saccharimonadales bacterium]
MAKSKARQKSLSAKTFDGTWNLFVKHWKLLLSLAAIQAAFDFTILNTAFKDVRDYLYDSEGIETFTDFVENAPANLSPYLTISLLVGLIMAGAFIGSLITIIRDKKEINLFGALRYGVDHFWALFSIAIVVGLIVMVGLSLLIVPGAIAAVLLMFSFHVRLDQEIGIVDSMKESLRVVRVDWKQLLYVLLGIIGVAIAGDLIGRALSSALNTTGASAITLLLTIPTSTYMAVMFTKAYFVFK